MGWGNLILSAVQGNKDRKMQEEQAAADRALRRELATGNIAAEKELAALKIAAAKEEMAQREKDAASAENRLIHRAIELDAAKAATEREQGIANTGAWLSKQSLLGSVPDAVAEQTWRANQAGYGKQLTEQGIEGARSGIATAESQRKRDTAMQEQAAAQTALEQARNEIATRNANVNEKAQTLAEKQFEFMTKRPMSLGGNSIYWPTSETVVTETEPQWSERGFIPGGTKTSISPDKVLRMKKEVEDQIKAEEEERRLKGLDKPKTIPTQPQTTPWQTGIGALSGLSPTDQLLLRATNLRF